MSGKTAVEQTDTGQSPGNALELVYLDVARIKPYEHNPRRAPNAEFDRIKVNPLANWPAERIAAYIAERDLPKHPLVAQGYASIGCAPCTSPVGVTEDSRAGRWRGEDKTECGIHFAGAKVVRSNPSRRDEG